MGVVDASVWPRSNSTTRNAARGPMESHLYPRKLSGVFADLGVLADRDPEEACKILDPVLKRMMEAVHRYEGTVNQVMSDRIMALFGAPVA